MSEVCYRCGKPAAGDSMTVEGCGVEGAEFCDKCQAELSAWLDVNPAIVALRFEVDEAAGILDDCERRMNEKFPESGHGMDSFGDEFDAAVNAEMLRAGKGRARKVHLFEMARVEVVRVEEWMGQHQCGAGCPVFDRYAEWARLSAEEAG